MDSRLILLVNELQQMTGMFSGPKLAFPHIVVVGNESAGKSTLLQVLMGEDILPAGADKVTRRPIMLQLIHIEPEEAKKLGVTKYVVFPTEDPNRKYTDLREVKKKLREAMDGVSKSETNIKDEPSNAPELIRELVKRHIEPENVIILAVSAGNTNVTTSSAVKLAEEVDPNGDRTVLAVTKLDLVVDEGDVDMTVNLLIGQTKPYKEGIVGVINRRPDQQNPSRKSVTEARAEEVTILQKKFQPLATQKGAGTLRLGSEYLQQLLSKLLIRKISEYLSADIHRKIDDRLEQCKAVLRMYGDGSLDVNKFDTLENAIVTFSHLFSEAIMGNAKDLTTIKPLIGQSTYEIFFADFPAELQLLLEAEMFSDEQIQEAIRLAMGPFGRLSAPFNALASLAREYITMTREPCRKAATNVKNGLSHTMEKCRGAMPGHIARFPVLLNAITQKTSEFLAIYLEKTQAALKTEIDMEWEYINVNHPDFDKVCEAVQAKPNAVLPSVQTNQNKHQQNQAADGAPQSTGGRSAVEDNSRSRFHETKRVPKMLQSEPNDIKLALHAYIDITYRKTLAMVPRVIYYHMIKELKENLEGTLRKYFHENLQDTLFDEPADIVEKRTEAEKGIKECEDAKHILAEMIQYCSRREA